MAADPPDLGMVCRSLGGWIQELRAARAESDPVLREHLLDHLEKNLQGALNILEYYRNRPSDNPTNGT